MKHLQYIALWTSLLLAMTACSDDVVQENNEGKTPIELSVGVKAQTRAITIDPNDVTKLDVIPTGTALYMVMKSEKTGSSDMYSVTKGVTKEADASTKESVIDFSESGCTRYWDDCYARDAQLSIFAACSPGGSTSIIKIGGKDTYPYTSTPTTGAWSTTSISQTIENWEVSAAQTSTTFVNENLCYSNNISKYTSGGSEVDKRLKFDSTTKKFTTDKLVFYHAMSWITFEIVMGDGFTDDEFKFADGTNIKLTNFSTKNTEFNLVKGEFTGTYSSSTINTIAQRTTATSGSKFTLDALLMPTTDMNSTTEGDISLTIAGNKYGLTKKSLLDKIPDADKTSNMLESKQLKPGVHYIFTLKIGKTKIDGISAKVVTWETVSADDLQPSNAQVQLALEERGDAVTSEVDFYRTKDPDNSTNSFSYEGYSWASGYEKGTVSYNDTKLLWVATNWYWPDNASFYHFRAVGDKSTSNPAVPTVSDDKFTLNASQTYKDYIWGAPFKDIESTATLSYSTTKGFDGTGAEAATPTHQIYKAIGPTNDVIKLLMFHMMSDLTINVQSVSGDGAVALTVGSNKTTIKFENIYTTGTVALGNGLVSTSGTSSTTEALTMSSTTDNQWTYGAIPQDLTNVVLVITTPDKNEYRVNMKDVLASTVSSNNIANPYTANASGKYTIDKWYPDFKYNYTFKLSKNKIENITATILDWETVTAGDDNVQIK